MFKFRLASKARRRLPAKEKIKSLKPITSSCYFLKYTYIPFRVNCYDKNIYSVQIILLQ